MDDAIESATDFVKPPQQERSRRTLRRLVTAALGLIEERGVDGASVQEIARRAGASVGSFYARFEGKEDLLRYLEVQLWTDAIEGWAEAVRSRSWDRLPFDQLVAGMVRVLEEVERTGSRQRRALEGRRDPGSVSPAARAFDERVRDDLRRLLLRHAEHIHHPDPARAIDVALAVVVGAVRLPQDAHPVGETLASLDADTRVDELTRVCLAYFGGTATSPDGPGQMDFFEIWG